MSAAQYGIQVESSNGTYELCLCPFHEDSKPSAWFNVKKRLFYCSVCDKGYNEYQLSKLLSSEMIVGKFEVEPGAYSLFEEEKVEKGFKSHNDYLDTRHIEPWYSKKYLEINFDGDVYFPNFDLKDVREGCIIRRRFGHKAKYIKRTNLPLWPFSELNKNPKNILLVEGLFSAARIRQACEKQNIQLFECFSMLGVTSRNLCPFIVDRKVSAYFDNDKGGETGLKNFKRLYSQHTAKRIKPSPDDMTNKQFEKFLKHVTNYFLNC